MAFSQWNWGGGWPKNWGNDWAQNWGKWAEDLSELQKDYFTANPEPAYSAITKPAGDRASNAFAAWLKNQSGDYYNRYLSDLGAGKVGMATEYYDWLRNPNWANPYQDFMKLSSSERGERPNYYVGRARWIP